MSKTPGQSPKNDRIIIHFDYDCFYASVVENETPALKSIPLAIQQKQIVVTCNYEARRRGLRKLQLITEAKRICPEAVIILGEDLTRFRNASKDLYNFLRDSIWSFQAEKLGFDEVWLDCTDMIDYNVPLLNENDLSHSFFCLDKDDPTVGFEFDATSIFGPTYPPDFVLGAQLKDNSYEWIHRRLLLGSHLARHLRQELESKKGYTATVGISHNKVLSKLVGNVNKPKNQTTIMPADPSSPIDYSSIITFMDSHDIGKIPGVGFKLSQKIREQVLGRAPAFEEGLVYGGSKEHVSVRDVRLSPRMGPHMLEEILSGPGSQKGIGGKIWDLIHGIDEIEVALAKRVPSQISQEDSYVKYLRTFEDAKRQLHILAKRLITRMRIDLTEENGDEEDIARRWLAHPRTLRLSTRPRPPLNADGTRSRNFTRISRSGPMPTFVFNLHENEESLADKLVEEILVPMFRKLHPEKKGWNLSLINIAVTNMAETGGESRDSEGRDIGRMFLRQDEVLRDFKVTEVYQDTPESASHDVLQCTGKSKNRSVETVSDAESEYDRWSDEEAENEALDVCPKCQMRVPMFAAAAHRQYHEMGA